jgi:DNA-binding CsgD family transcriptional regulator
VSTSVQGRRGVAAGGTLLEREAELAVMVGVLDRLREGQGGLIVLRGPAGIGKTGLLEAVRAHAVSRGVRVFSARGAEIEAGVGFGLARQLLEGPVRSAKGTERRRLLEAAGPAAAAQLGIGDAGPEPRGSDPVGALVHGFYWLIASLAEEPLLIAIDDLQWADPPSTRLLAHTARRLEGLPLTLALAVRTDTHGAEDPWQEFAATGAEVLEPRPLSRAAVAELGRRQFGEQVDDAFAGACHDVTGGNPFLAGELLAELAREAVVPSAESIPIVRSVGPKGIARSVLVRIAALGTHAVALARAVAVLGEDVAIRHAAAVAELEPSEAAAAASALARAVVLVDRLPLAFAHPVLRAAVEADMPAAARAVLHARSAATLRDDGVEPERIAAHLLASEPGMVDGARGILLEAAESALERGVPAEAVRLLSRLSEEPGAEESSVRLLLGIASVRAGDPAGIEHLEAVMSIGDSDERSEAARALAVAFTAQGEIARAVATLEKALEDTEDRELELRLEAELVAVASLEPATQPLAAARLAARTDIEGDTPAERLLLANVASHLAIHGAGSEAAADAASRALGAGTLVAEETADTPSIYHALLVLLYADRFDEAEAILALAVEDAQRRGSLFGFALASNFQAFCAWCRGDVMRAEAAARASVEAVRDAGWPLTLSSALGHLIDALVERGDIPGARAELEAYGMAETIPDGRLFVVVLESRGKLRLAEGDHAGVLEDIAEAARRETEWLDRVTGAGGTTYRSWAAPALAALGRVEEATRRADEELEIARAWGGRRAIGMALRAKGLVTPGDDGISFLEQAVATLDGSGAQLELARALTDLGAAIRRAGRRTESREPLRRGLSLADQCGATVLAERAREELRLAGAKPRRAAISGPASLTPSERRIAEQAAAGKTNRQIAQELFLTMKTVAFHLTNAYRKLDVTSREELPAALSATD